MALGSLATIAVVVVAAVEGPKWFAPGGAASADSDSPYYFRPGDGSQSVVSYAAAARPASEPANDAPCLRPGGPAPRHRFLQPKTQPRPVEIRKQQPEKTVTASAE